ncbi:cell division protein FtsQ [Tumebacillus sp. BK434]|uniref:cell division protein FtsQ/DivIB n=1 Tax=Tumebacillus sp. BK434 TaxID=2512169 RepID=UPI0010DE69BE|nr:FtsQ-type POTRA domain-containing protein [Tumebacillus sp. BK434]TCP52930.1 cell division protein FtsQ [Tumebacillus sp. BK434]
MPKTPPPTVLESYAEQHQQPKGKRRPNRKALLFVVVFFGGLLVAGFLQSPLSEVSYLEVKGNHQLRYEEILRTAELEKGMSLLAVDKGDVKDKIQSAFPLVQSVDVQVSWKGEVVIAVVEKKAAGQMVQGATLYRILQDGTVLAGTEKLEAEQLPVISMDRPGNLQPGQKISSPDLQELAKQIPEVDRAVLDQISEIRVTSEGPWRIYMRDKFEVRIPPRQFADKMKSYLAYRGALPADTKPGIINMLEANYLENFKPEEQKGD